MAKRTNNDLQKHRKLKVEQQNPNKTGHELRNSKPLLLRYLCTSYYSFCKHIDMSWIRKGSDCGNDQRSIFILLRFTLWLSHRQLQFFLDINQSIYTFIFPLVRIQYYIKPVSFHSFIVFPSCFTSVICF